MPLSPGTWLNHYQILGHLGTGGMGEVYRALDNKLQREVALKVLPKAFAQDPERLARFRREAQVLAQLNHVNIAAIHTVEQSGETHFLVMELALGETLRDRIHPSRAREQAAHPSPVPLEEALDICKQIAAGLECAHEKPIVHRDLKPANIKVTPEGVVKILDFGLARAFSGDTASSDPANSPTLSAMTVPGTILGTAAYMSPEQARGKKVDKRTDIWALGCVLYELLTAKPAFDGEDIPDILAAVMKGEPDWTALPESTPPNVRFALRRCLEKDAKRRFHAATDVAISLEEPWSVSIPAPPPAPVPEPPVWRRPVPLHVATLGALVALIFVGLAVWNLKPPVPAAQAPAHLNIALPPGDRLAAHEYPPLALSPDGSHLVYVAIRNDVQQLFLRAMDSREAKPLSGTEGAASPFFSPDGEWIGFFAGGKLKKVSIAGGAPQTVCDSAGNGGASWGTDGNIVFTPSFGSGLLRVSAAGGTPEVLTTLDPTQDELSHRWPQFLPDGNTLLFTVMTGAGWDGVHTAVLRFDTGERRVVHRGALTGLFVPTGHLVYERAGTLLAVPFDLARLEVTSSAPVTIAEGVTESVATLGAEYSFSVGGALAYVPASPRQFERRLVWVDRKGEVEPLPAPPRHYRDVALSPDGRQVAISIRSGKEEIWLYDLARGTLTRLTSESGDSRNPVWTPDGKRIAYLGTRAGLRNVFWRTTEGTGVEERLTTGDTQWPMSWSPDGKWLAFGDLSTTTGGDVWTLPLDGGPGPIGAEARKPQPLIRTPFAEYGGVFSPDGRWLSYSSDESGRQEIYVRSFPDPTAIASGRQADPGGKWQISSEGGGGDENPYHWARNGRELFYRNGNKMMAVDIQTEPSFTAGRPRLLFEGQYEDWWDVAADGQRFLMVQSVEPEQPATQIHVVLNWFEELKRRVPTGQ
jgi:serine/threonine-protein kinase